MTGSLAEQLERLFHPRAMAVVGVSDDIENMGMSFLRGYQKHGFKGQLYAIHPRKTFSRFETYPSISAVPGPVDFVNVCVPAAVVPEVIADCGKKGITGAAIFSSGFGEAGTEEGRRLEEELAAVARRAGVRLIGPNCMGIHCPASGMTFRADMPVMPPGNISLISQSGGVAISTTMTAAERGVGLCKVVSFGNEIDLGPAEFLPYLARDPETKVICLYLEGTKRPAELRAALQDAAVRKPVILLKGGNTAAGTRAVASHTGALAGRSETWQALAKQTGVLTCSDIDEMIDLAFLHALSRPPAGNRACLLTVSGGFGVFGTDQITRAGFEMPELRPETRASLREHFDAPGTSTRNPVDLAARFFQFRYYKNLFTTLDRDPNIDFFILVCAMEYMCWLGSKADEMSAFLTAALQNGLKFLTKPVYVVFYHTIMEHLRLKLERSFLVHGFPVFRDMQRCLLALNRSRQRK